MIRLYFINYGNSIVGAFMATFDITVFITQALYDNGNFNYGDGWRARDRVITFIDGAFGLSDHDANIDGADVAPAPPVETVHQSFTGSCICNPTFDCQWDDLLAWWDDWLMNADCKDPHPQSSDLNLLVSNADGGGLGGGRNDPPGTCVAGTGKAVIDLPSSYDPFVWTDAGKGMWVTLQEMGHTLLHDVPDKDGDGVGHDTGAIVQDIENKQYSVTPMGITGSATNSDGDELNNCDNPHDKDLADNDGDGSIDGRNSTSWNASCTEKFFTKMVNQ